MSRVGNRIGELLGTLCTLGSVLALAGCVSMKTGPAPTATVLMSVVLRGESPATNEPVGLLVSLDGHDGYEGRQFAFAPNTRIPGHYATFLVRLSLPVGPHHLTRLSGVTGAGVPIPEFDVDLDLRLEARARATDYVGHLELSRAVAGPTALASSQGPMSPAGVQLVLADTYEDDLPNFVHAYPTLRGHSVSRRAPTQLTALTVRARGPVASTAASVPFGGVSGLDVSAADALPPAARAPFRAFLKKQYPRAFAVSAVGQTGMATGGADVIERALRACRHAAGTHAEKSRCTLFALDDTLVASVSSSTGHR